MKKLLIALLALGALSFAPEAEARSKKENCEPCKMEKPKKSCEECTTVTVETGTSEQKCDKVMPAKRKVTHYEDITTCVRKRPHYKVGEAYCDEDAIRKQRMNDE